MGCAETETTTGSVYIQMSAEVGRESLPLLLLVAQVPIRHHNAVCRHCWSRLADIMLSNMTAASYEERSLALCDAPRQGGQHQQQSRHRLALPFRCINSLERTSRF